MLGFIASTGLKKLTQGKFNRKIVEPDKAILLQNWWTLKYGICTDVGRTAISPMEREMIRFSTGPRVTFFETLTPTAELNQIKAIAKVGYTVDIAKLQEPGFPLHKIPNWSAGLWETILLNRLEPLIKRLGTQYTQHDLLQKMTQEQIETELKEQLQVNIAFLGLKITWVTFMVELEETMQALLNENQRKREEAQAQAEYEIIQAQTEAEKKVIQGKAAIEIELAYLAKLQTLAHDDPDILRDFIELVEIFRNRHQVTKVKFSDSSSMNHHQSHNGAGLSSHILVQPLSSSNGDDGN